MKTPIAYCGLDCETCEARIAAMNDDDALDRLKGREPDAPGSPRQIRPQARPRRAVFSFGRQLFMES